MIATRIARAAGAAALAGATTWAPATGTVHAAPGCARSPAGEGTLYGDPVAAAAFWRYQEYDDCVEMAVADVVGEPTGHQHRSGKRRENRCPNGHEGTRAGPG